MGRISFPWVTDGWYWAPEVWNIKDYPFAEVLEGWTFVPDAGNTATLPFAWVADMYEQRRAWKDSGVSSQYALKLCMNSLYGKMAQRVGWDKEKMRAPKWHQLEWAGWVTSLTRSMIYQAATSVPADSLIASETDAIYTTVTPTLSSGIGHGLGQWEEKRYDEIIYLQSGLAWVRQGDIWTPKRRGLDPGAFSLEDCQAYADHLRPNDKDWPAYVGGSTRFIGIGAALARRDPKARHCAWITNQRDINVGRSGKRAHECGGCRACRAGVTAGGGLHSLSIKTGAWREARSYPHDIPWQGGTDFEWRDGTDDPGYQFNDREIERMT